MVLEKIPDSITLKIGQSGIFNPRSSKWGTWDFLSPRSSILAIWDFWSQITHFNNLGLRIPDHSFQPSGITIPDDHIQPSQVQPTQLAPVFVFWHHLGESRFPFRFNFAFLRGDFRRAGRLSCCLCSEVRFVYSAVCGFKRFLIGVAFLFVSIVEVENFTEQGWGQAFTSWVVEERKIRGVMRSVIGETLPMSGYTRIIPECLDKDFLLRDPPPPALLYQQTIQKIGISKGWKTGGIP